jgi:hypothetical protein
VYGGWVICLVVSIIAVGKQQVLTHGRRRRGESFSRVRVCNSAGCTTATLMRNCRLRSSPDRDGGHQGPSQSVLQSLSELHSKISKSFICSPRATSLRLQPSPNPPSEPPVPPYPPPHPSNRISTPQTRMSSNEINGVAGNLGESHPPPPSAAAPAMVSIILTISSLPTTSNSPFVPKSPSSTPSSPRHFFISCQRLHTNSLARNLE